MLSIFKRSLSTRLIASTILVETTTILLLGSILILVANNTLHENIIRLQNKYADNLSGKISSYITNAISDLQMLDVFDISGFEGMQRQKVILENLIIYKPSLFSQITLIDMSGNERIRLSRYHTYLASELGNIRKTIQFETASKGGIYLSRVFLSPESGLLSIQVAIRIKSQGGYAVLLSDINISRLWQEISDIKIGGTGYAYLVDKKGRYLASQSASDVLRDYGIAVGNLTPVNAFISSKSQYDISSYQGLKKKRVIGVYSPIRNTDWAVIVELPISEAYKGIIKMLAYLCTFMLLGSVLAGFAIYVISKKIVRHMNQLSSAAVKIGKGNLDIIIPGQHLEDEVGLLARTMSGMRTELKESYKNLEIQLSELRIAQKALSDSERTIKAIFDNVYQLIGLMNTDGILLDANKAALSFSKLEKSDIIGKPFWQGPWWKHSAELQEKLREMIQRAAAGEFIRFEATHEDYEGRIHFIDFSIKPVFDEENRVVMLIPEGRDITERKEAEDEKLKLEERLRQAQKMESIASLAGGIAHDFNNVLGGIVGTVSLLKYNFEKNREMDTSFIYRMISVIETSADRAKNIVKHLLTISKKQDYQLIPVDINVSVENVVKLCSNSFDKSIEIRCNHYNGVAMVNADPSQIEQVLLNVCINSAHAMTIMRKNSEHIGGVLTLEISMIESDRHFFDTHPEAAYKRYILVSITDTGVGMSRDIISKVFDPFFTTKDKENGTGLGLSMVYNIVHEHKGFIDIISSPDQGATFNIYLPYLEETGIPTAVTRPERIYHGTGLVLVIDDEEVMRNVASEILTECGYSVLLAEDSNTGLEILKQYDSEITVILLDMAMPVMSGKETYMEIKKINPAQKVILSSGFKQDRRVIESMKMGVDAFIQKPYTIYNLSEMVYRTLKENDDYI